MQISPQKPLMTQMMVKKKQGKKKRRDVVSKIKRVKFQKATFKQGYTLETLALPG